MPADNV